jgi:hypothetical protein
MTGEQDPHAVALRFTLTCLDLGLFHRLAQQHPLVPGVQVLTQREAKMTPVCGTACFGPIETLAQFARKQIKYLKSLQFQPRLSVQKPS